MKKTGLPLAYPNIPQLSSVAATLLAAALPLPALPSHASPGGGREGASLAPQRMAFPFCRGFLGGAFAGALLDAGGAAVHVVAVGMTDDEARELME